MTRSGVDLGVLSILPLRASALDSPEAIQEWLRSAGPAERSRQVGAMSKTQVARFAALLDATTGPELLRSIDVDLAARVIRSADLVQAGTFIAAMDSDEGAEILRTLGDTKRTELLAQTDPATAETLRNLLRYAPNSVAAHMLPELFTIDGALSAAAAEDAVREQANQMRGKIRAGGYIYVTDADRRLIGVVGFRDLVLAEPEQPVHELIDDHPVSVRSSRNAENAAQLLVDHDLTALPVVDERRKLLGVLTADAAADILEREATEDAERQGGSAPLEVPYLRASPIRLWRKRIVWLLVLFVAEAYTGTVLRAFEDELEAVVALAFFIPLLIGTGGNTGTQITTTLVRAMATGQMRFRDLPRALLKEMSTGALVAVTMAAAAVVRAWTLGVGPQVTVTVSVTVAAIVMWSALVATVLPPLLKKLRVDPAVVSAPMIATIVDGTGLLIYFLIAHLTLPQLAGL
ncbi:magnesium transporter [Mycolicibacterium sp. 120322]